VVALAGTKTHQKATPCNSPAISGDTPPELLTREKTSRGETLYRATYKLCARMYRTTGVSFNYTYGVTIQVTPVLQEDSLRAP